MKYLSHYVEKKVTKALDDAGAFFAFSTDQFEKQVDTTVKKYVRTSSGMFCPKSNADELFNRLDEIYEEGRKQDLAENGREGVIKRELNNHESYYTGDPTDAIETLKPYGITPEEVHNIFRNTWEEYCNQ